MDDFENKDMEGMESDTIIFEDEDGNEFEFAVRDYFFYNGDEYALLSEVGQEPDENGEECIICKVEAVTGEDGEAIDRSPTPMRILTISAPDGIKAGDILRKKI